MTPEEKRERQREYYRRYREKNPERAKAKARENSLRYYQKNSEAINAKHRATYAKDLEVFRAKKREYDDANRELVNAQARARRALISPERKAEIDLKARDRTRAWNKANSARKAENDKKYRALNKEKKAADDKAWREANRDRRNASNQRRRAAKQNATLALFPVTAEVIKERLVMTDGCCYCGQDKPLHVEHVVALNDGGWHIPSNILGACKSCNSSKNDRPVEQWFRAQPFFSEDRWQKIQELTK